MDQAQLRSLVATIQDRLAPGIASAATADDKAQLTKAWDSLVLHLALGPAPSMRPCPHCKREIMRAATLCGYCWTKLAS